MPRVLSTDNEPLGAILELLTPSQNIKRPRALDVTSLLPGQPIYDIRDYGAVGDFIVDDIGAINAVIAAANARPGPIFLMERHRFTQAWNPVLNNNIRIIGRGEFNGGTMLNYDPPGAVAPAVITIGGQYSGLESVWCISSRASQTGFYVLCDGAYRPQLKNVLVSGYGNAFEIRACVGALLRDCQAGGIYGRYGFYAHGVDPFFCHNTYFDNCGGGTDYLMPVTGTPGAWAPSTAYAVGNIVKANGGIWQCSTAGVSAGAGTGPSGLPTTSTATVNTTPVTDGTVQWRFAMGAASGFAHGSFAHTFTLLKCGWLQGDIGLEVVDDAPAAGSGPVFTHSWQFSTDHPFSRGCKIGGAAVWFDQPLITSVQAGDGLEVTTAAAGVNVDGGQIFGCARSGVTYAGTGGLRLASVEIGPVGGVAPNTIDSIAIANNSQNFKVNDCISGSVPGFATSSRYGISIGTGCDNFEVEGNTLNGNLTGPILNNTERSSTRIVRNNVPESAYYDATDGVYKVTLNAGVQTLTIPNANVHTVIVLCAGAAIIDQIVHPGALSTQNSGVRLRIFREGNPGNNLSFRDNNASQNSIWTPNSVDWVLSRFNDAVEIQQLLTTTLNSVRWRILDRVRPGATISVPVPAVAAATMAYLDVSVVGSSLQGIGTTDLVVGSPTADLAAAGAAAGYYVGCRVSAVDVLRLTFQGTLAGGAVNFNFWKVNP